jgi:hypothetical protein
VRDPLEQMPGIGQGAAGPPEMIGIDAHDFF